MQPSKYRVSQTPFQSSPHPSLRARDPSRAHHTLSEPSLRARHPSRAHHTLPEPSLRARDPALQGAVGQTLTSWLQVLSDNSYAEHSAQGQHRPTSPHHNSIITGRYLEFSFIIQTGFLLLFCTHTHQHSSMVCSPHD